MMRLNVTTTQDNSGRDLWVGYVVLNGYAVRLATASYNGLDDLRYYAMREGFEGILIGPCSVPWAHITPLNGSMARAHFES